MKLNIYKNQKEIEKVVKCEEYDIFYGTIEDAIILFDSLDDMHDEKALLKFVRENKKKIDDLLKDIFSADNLTDEELRRVKVKELVPFFFELVTYVKSSFNSNGKN